ncbi:MAG: S8 family serine peptidase [Luteimonas sp.]
MERLATNTGERSWFANHGASVHIAAPARTLCRPATRARRHQGHSPASNSGTSMAVPRVAGVAALVRSAATSPAGPGLSSLHTRVTRGDATL